MNPPGTPADSPATAPGGSGAVAPRPDAAMSSETVAPEPATPETAAPETETPEPETVDEASTAEAELDRVRKELEAIDASRASSGFLGSLMGALGARQGSRPPRDRPAAAPASAQPHATPPVGDAPEILPLAGAAPEPAPPPPKPDPLPWTSPLRADDPSSRRLAYRLETPARFDTGEESFRTLDWSLGGFALAAGSGSFKQGQRVTGTFTVYLDQFVVTTTVTADVVYSDRKRLGFRFHDLSHAQIRMLRSLVGALMAGQVPLTIGIGETARRRRIDQARGAARGRPPRLVRLLSSLLNGVLVMVVVGIGLFMFFTPIEPSFTAETGAVAAPQITVVAPAGGAVVGVLVEEGDEVVPGTALASVDATSGGRMPLESPCYCVVHAIAEAGTGVAGGEPVARLYASTAIPLVQAVFGRDRADVLVPGRIVSIRLPYSGRTISGRIERVTSGMEEGWIGVPASLGNAPGRLVAWIQPDPPLAPAAVGEPVVVTFEPSSGL